MTNETSEVGWKEIEKLSRERQQTREQEAMSRKALLEEQKTLQARLDEIQRMLLVLDGESIEDLRQNRLTKSAPKVVLELLQTHPEGLTVAEIEERSTNRNLQPWSFHTALYRLVKSGEITFTGNRGGRVYRLITSGSSGSDSAKSPCR